MLTGVVQSRGSIQPRQVDCLYELFVRYYDRVDRSTFDRDWLEKDWALLLHDEKERLRGFTTLQLYDLEVFGRRIRAVFNGNTIIDQACWGEQELVRTWCRFMAELKAAAPSVPLYWYLICSGYRTYLFLPLFFRSFVPGRDDGAYSFERNLRDYLGRLKFPDEYQGGIVHVSEPRECLRPDLAVPSESKLKNRHVRFFLEQNPGYSRGNELVCLAEYSLENTRRTARRALEELAAQKTALNENASELARREPLVEKLALGEVSSKSTVLSC